MQLAQEQAVGHHLDPGLRADLGVEADAVADRLAHRLPQHRRHPAGSGAGGEAPRLQHQDLAALQPTGLQQGQRHAGGLARTRRGLEHGGAAAVQRLQERGQDGIDWKGRQGGEGGLAHGGSLLPRTGAKGNAFRAPAGEARAKRSQGRSDERRVATDGRKKCMVLLSSGFFAPQRDP